MREGILPILFWAAFAMAGLAVATALWVVLGTMQHAEGRTLNAFWTTASRRYGRLMLAFFVLFAAVLFLMVFGEWVRRHP
jgi:hypothetical protein